MEVGAMFETKGNYCRSSMTRPQGRHTLVSIPSFVNQSSSFILYMVSFDVNFTKFPLIHNTLLGILVEPAILYSLDPSYQSGTDHFKIQVHDS